MKIKQGDKINTFTVLELARPGALGRHKRWHVLCECGRELEKDSNDIKRQASCGCLNKFDPASTMYWHMRYRHGKHAGEAIDFEEFTELALSNCFYCDSPPANNCYGLTYTGIDRIDSSVGYIKGNVRPCCWICNRMKSDLTEAEFFDHTKRITQVRIEFESGKVFV